MCLRIPPLGTSARFPLFAAALGLALLVTGCETDGGIAARTREKSAVYATLKVSEKRFIDKGVIAIGFTPDMVYVAMGHPSKVESKDYPEGKRELWTYSRYYPNYDPGTGFKTVPYSTEGHYQRALSQDAAGTDPHSNFNAQIPNGMDENQGPDIFKAGRPQGVSSAEPADLQSYTFLILFKDGKVARFGADPNYN